MRWRKRETTAQLDAGAGEVVIYLFFAVNMAITNRLV
jgi:hypothetical protein